MSWGAQELFDSLQDPIDDADRDGDEALPKEDKPAPWIASTQDAPAKASLAPAAATPLGQRRLTQSNLSSSVGQNALLGVPSASRRVHRPSDAALFAPSNLSPAAGHRSMSSTDEYARIIIQSRNAKMQKWRAQNPSRLGPQQAGRRNDASTHESAWPSRIRSSRIKPISPCRLVRRAWLAEVQPSVYRGMPASRRARADSSWFSGGLQRQHRVATRRGGGQPTRTRVVRLCRVRMGRLARRVPQDEGSQVAVRARRGRSAGGR